MVVIWSIKSALASGDSDCTKAPSRAQYAFDGASERRHPIRRRESNSGGGGLADDAAFCSFNRQSLYDAIETPSVCTSA